MGTSQPKAPMPAQKLTLLSLLTAIALIIFIVEAQLPPLAPIPGIKLGLANIVSLFAMFWLSRRDALMILIVRVILGSIFSGHVMVLFYSLCGGLLSFLVVALFLSTFSLKAIWIPSIIGGICHNIGQIAVAVAVTKSFAIVTYLPMLVIAGMAAGLFTGLAAQFLINHNAFLQKPYECKR